MIIRWKMTICSDLQWNKPRLLVEERENHENRNKLYDDTRWLVILFDRGTKYWEVIVERKKNSWNKSQTAVWKILLVFRITCSSISDLWFWLAYLWLFLFSCSASARTRHDTRRCKRLAKTYPRDQCVHVKTIFSFKSNEKLSPLGRFEFLNRDHGNSCDPGFNLACFHPIELAWNLVMRGSRRKRGKELGMLKGQMNSSECKIKFFNNKKNSKKCKKLFILGST